MADDLQGQWNISDPDIFNIILRVNKELLERTGNKVLQYGDILVDTSRNAMICPEGGDTCLWPTSKDGNVYVPYALNETYNENQRRKIKKALDEIGALTCVKFYYKRRNDQNYVNVQPGPACYSSVGFGRNGRILSLKNPECIHFGVISHEFLHAIGFQHEQSRSDRDLYIQIIWENISDDLKYNFNKLDTNNLGTKYDYGSVMQYGRTAFSKNGRPTMVPIPDSDIELGQMRGLSTVDVYKVNKLYKCKVCGNSFVADTGRLTSPNYPGLYPNNADCKWLIRAKRHLKILLEFSDFQIQEFAGCIGDRLTIYDGSSVEDNVLEGPACGAENPAVISKRNELFITFITSRTYQSTGFAATYRFIKCGHMKKDRRGIIESKSHPFKEVHCFWAILIKRRYKIIMEFEGTGKSQKGNCTENSLIIYDAARTPPITAEIFCNNASLSLPFVVSTGRALVLEFQHVPSIFNRGFKIAYDTFVIFSTLILVSSATK
ncbi:hypothetical protein chiPu_0014309 [Chiloscyllium punctatum]|uniref:Metalloendopeptidase n=1 Tax=Chiloscyllium punctatum TaxID=137246 RepID=A0A401SZL1_CHIPU|nr:hypothetical protein [Chiloscyllium punctatum]